MQKSFFLILLSIFFIKIASSQNLNFSQYYYTPTITNPAMIGSDGYFKVSLHYRQQRTAVGQGFRTPMLYAIYPFFNQKTGKRWGAVGLTVLNDQEGDFLNTSGGALTFAYNISTGKIGRYNTNLSFGGQAGYFNRNFDVSNVITPDQITNNSTNTNENFNNTSTNFLTASAGLYWYAIDEQQQPVFFLGVASNNLNQPNIAAIDGNEDPLFQRLNIIGAYRIWYNGTFSIMPTFQAENINDNNDFRVGSWFRYHLAGSGVISSGSLGTGIWYNSNQAAVVSLEFLQKNYFINAAFEFPSSSDASSPQGGSPEITIGYRKSLKPTDTDQDGIFDKKDECSEVFGLEKFNGCPDTDGDNIPDKEDKCPEEAGVPELQGCPKKEGGVGYPEHQADTTDTDGDGVLDTEDQCPEEYGTAELNGCPDTDGDGIPDNIDACPTQSGRIELNGCQSFTVEEEMALDSLLKRISSRDFEENISEIPPKLYDDLDELAETLKEHPEVTVIIEGHADVLGEEEVNVKLSEERAETVKSYLQSKGLSNEMITAGYGSLKPVASNDTKEGRKQNRRVDIKLRYE